MEDLPFVGDWHAFRLGVIFQFVLNNGIKRLYLRQGNQTETLGFIKEFFVFIVGTIYINTYASAVALAKKPKMSVTSNNNQNYHKMWRKIV